MEPFVDALLVEVMTTWPEASDLLSALEVTHTHHTTLVISVCFEMVSGRQSVDLFCGCTCKSHPLQGAIYTSCKTAPYIKIR
jgi:hypothetical protein